MFRAAQFYKCIFDLILIVNQFGKGDLDKKALQIKAGKIREKISKLGPTYIKFGQILSVRYDIFPEIICTELQKLLDNTEKVKYNEINEILVSSLGQEKLDMILEIDKDPIAVASLGQVHKAVLKDGRQVAIKIQKPGIRKQIRNDIKLLYLTAGIFDRLPFLNARASELVEEFDFWITRELDYILEANNSKTFSDLFKDEKRVYVPKVIWELTESKVLVTEYIDGVSMKEIIKYIDINPELQRLSIRGYTFEKKRAIRYSFKFDISSIF